MVTKQADIKRRIYTITYTLNGGSYGSSHPSSYKAGQKVTISDPAKSGYTFTGWTGSKTGKNLSFSNTTGNQGYSYSFSQIDIICDVICDSPMVSVSQSCYVRIERYSVRKIAYFLTFAATLVNCRHLNHEMVAVHK